MVASVIYKSLFQIYQMYLVVTEDWTYRYLILLEDPEANYENLRHTLTET